MKRKLLLPLHIGAGVGSLALPLVLWAWEMNRETHAPLPLYLLTNGLCLANAALGLILVRRRVPVSGYSQESRARWITAQNAVSHSNLLDPTVYLT